MLAANPNISENARIGYSGDRSVLLSERINEPMRLKKASRIGVQFMGDLFHESIPPLWIRLIFNTIERSPWHTFLILTKRPERMIETLGNTTLFIKSAFPWKPEIPKNVWLGITIENQNRLEEGLSMFVCEMRRWFAGVLFISFEPLLGPIEEDDIQDFLGEVWLPGDPDDEGDKWIQGIDWVICGGETGPKARPMDPDWARSIRDQCREAGVPLFMKQMSGKEAIPEDLMIREYPNV